MFIASIVAVIVAATAGGVLLGTDLVDRSYEFSPMTPIAHASPGSTIKIYGVIQGGLGTVVLNGVFVSSGKSSHWSWTNYNFFVLVGNSTVQVNVAQLGNSVYGSPHDLSSDQEQYWVGDSVAVVGTVTSSNGLDAKAVAPTPEGFWAAWEDDAAIIPLVLAGIFVGVLVVVHLLNGRRAIQHNARLASANPFAYQPVLDPPPIAPLP